MNSTVKLIHTRHVIKNIEFTFIKEINQKDIVVNDLLIWYVFQKIHKEIKIIYIRRNNSPI